jgi:hypothetical protein
VTPLLVTLSILEIVVVAGVLVVYLLKIAGSLRRTAVLLGKVSFGVRAIETQCSAIGPSVVAINGQLAAIAAGLGDLTELAGAGASSTPGPPRGH